MPKIKMARTERGSCDGLNVEEFVEGQEYDIPDSLIVAFRTMGALEEDGEPAMNAAPLETPEKLARGRKKAAE